MMIQSSFLYRLPYLFRAGESRVSDWLHNLKLWAKFLSDEQQAYVQGRRAEQKVCDWKMKAAKETDTVWRQMPSFLSSCYMDIKHKPNKSHSAWALLNKQGSRGETQRLQRGRHSVWAHSVKEIPHLLDQFGEIILASVALWVAGLQSSFHWQYQKMSFYLGTLGWHQASVV